MRVLLYAALGYLAACGTVVAACVAALGLLRAAAPASRGDHDKAGRDALAALAAPAVMAYDAASALFREAIGKARELDEAALGRGRLSR